MQERRRLISRSADTWRSRHAGLGVDDPPGRILVADLELESRVKDVGFVSADMKRAVVIIQLCR